MENKEQKSSETKQIGWKLMPGLIKRVKIRAIEEGCTESELVASAISKYLSSEEEKIHVTTATK